MLIISGGCISKYCWVNQVYCINPEKYMGKKEYVRRRNR